MIRVLLCAVMGCALLTGCISVPIGHIAPVSHVPSLIDDSIPRAPGGPRKLVVFFDGTSNTERSYTNIGKLHNLTTLQADPNINTLYIEGVGTRGRVLGLATGWGIGLDVRQAYQWLGEHFDDARGDQIFVFGFSRGAYAARILAALMHVAGVQDLSSMPPKQRRELVGRAYDVFKSTKTISDRRADLQRTLGLRPDSTAIEFLGLWDTVEALGWPDLKENYIIPNPRYADQICNVRKAAHAMSIDDDRARVFTPILLTQPHLVSQCDSAVRIASIVDEVWFSGAHADVGGRRGTDLDGVSLNWMLERIAPYGLVPPGARVHANRFDRSHDPEAGAPGLIYRKRNRDLTAYTSGNPAYNDGRLRIHRSVVDRLKVIPVASWESRWFESEKFRHCFVPVGGRQVFQGGTTCPVQVEP
jgi:uncharacterized protein (DUF2235 family)